MYSLNKANRISNNIGNSTYGLITIMNGYSLYRVYNQHIIIYERIKNRILPSYNICQKPE